MAICDDLNTCPRPINVTSLQDIERGHHVYMCGCGDPTLAGLANRRAPRADTDGDLALDVATLVARIRQINREGPPEHWLWDRIIGCDVPRLMDVPTVRDLVDAAEAD